MSMVEPSFWACLGGCMKFVGASSAGAVCFSGKG